MTKRQPPARRPFVFTVDGPALCELAERQNTEEERNVALLEEIARMIREQERQRKEGRT